MWLVPDYHIDAMADAAKGDEYLFKVLVVGEVGPRPSLPPSPSLLVCRAGPPPAPAHGLPPLTVRVPNGAGRGRQDLFGAAVRVQQLQRELPDDHRCVGPALAAPAARGSLTRGSAGRRRCGLRAEDHPVRGRQRHPAAAVGYRGAGALRQHDAGARPALAPPPPRDPWHPAAPAVHADVLAPERSAGRIYRRF